MSAMREINDAVRGMYKRAQGIMPPIYKPEVYREAGNAILKAPIALAGSMVGAGKAYSDFLEMHPDLIAQDAVGVPKTLDNDSAKEIDTLWPSMAEGFRIGAKTGWNEAGRAYSDMANAAAMSANDFFALPDKALDRVNKWNDSEILKSMRRYDVDMPDNPPKDPATGLLVPTNDPKYSQYDEFINWARGGQAVGRAGFGFAIGAATGGAAGRTLGAVSKSPRIGAAIGNMAVDVPVAMAWNEREGRIDNKRDFLRTIDFLEESDREHPDYRKIYEALREHRDLDPERFDSLEPPASPPSPEAKPSSSAPVSSGGKQQSGTRWTMSPGVQNGLAYGAGGAGLGALLGLVFGGKGGWWKWALLGSILGGLHGSGVTDRLLSSVR